MRKNRQLLELQSVYSQFADYLEELHEKARLLAKSVEERMILEKQIAVLGASIDRALKSFDEEDGEYAELIQAAQDEIRHLEHEILSIEWYRYTEEKEVLSRQQSQVQDQKAAAEKALDEVKLLLRQLECAREAAELADHQNQAALYEEKAASARLEDEEIILKRNGYGSRLYVLYSDLL